MSRTAAFAVLWMLALFGGGKSSFIPLAPLSLGKQAQIVNGWEAGRIPEPALEHIPAAVFLIVYSSHYCPLGSHGDSMLSVRPSDQINTRKELFISFCAVTKTPCVWWGFRRQRFHFTHQSTVITGQISWPKIEANFIILILEVLKAITSYYCRGIQMCNTDTLS
jgi:hypothetical protein